MRDALHGYVTAELRGAPPLVLHPRLLARPSHVAAARSFDRDPGHVRQTTAHNARKLLEQRELLGEPLAPAHARSLVRIAKHESLDEWLDALPQHAADRATSAKLAADLRDCVGAEPPESAPHILQQLGTRAFEEQIAIAIETVADAACAPSLSR